MDKRDINSLVQFGKKLKVLVVEDNKETREQILKLLDHLFGEIILATDGNDGLEKFQPTHCDLIISDINMPIMNGIDMAKKIKAINSDIPIIILSGQNEVEYFMDCIKIGIDGFLLKPLYLEQFLDILSKIVTNIENKLKVQRDLENKQQFEKQEALKDLLNNIMHHWRQPLSVISTAAGSIEMTNEYNMATKEKNIESSQQIIAATEFLSKMIGDFGKLFNDTHDNNTTTINFKEIVDDIILDSSGIEIVKNIEDITIVGNKNLVENILRLIYDNALEIFEEKNIKQKIVFININKKDDYINITIKDNGLGVEKDMLNKIFDPYFTTKHKSFGVGLSLYFVQYIVTKYLNGTIGVSNETYNYQNQQYTGAKFDIKIKNNSNYMD